MKKKISIAVIFILCMMHITTLAYIPEYGEEYANQPNSNYVVKFKDVGKNHWAFNYIMEMNERGVISGYPNKYFYPNNTITRAEFAKIMCLAGGIDIVSVTHTNYSDVNVNDWFAPYVESGKYYLSGYINGNTKYYLPNNNALREDIAVALVKLKGYDTSLYDETILKAMFTDYQSISLSARKYVAIALENGLISGYDDNTFRGQNTITRAEAATILWRAYQYGNGVNKVFDHEEIEANNKPNQISTPVNTPVNNVKEYEAEDTVDNNTHEQTEIQEPENSYSFELETLASNIYKIDKIAATNDSVFYLVDNVIYEASKSGVKVIFNGPESEYVGDSIQKLNKYDVKHLNTKVWTIGFNNNDNCKYAIIRQSNLNFMYNIDTGDVYHIPFIGNDANFYDRYMINQSFTFDDENNIILYGARIYAPDYSNYSLLTHEYMEQTSFVDGDWGMLLEGGMVLLRDNRTGKNKRLDMDIRPERSIGFNSHYYYFYDKHVIYKTNSNGDSEILCTVDDIDNIDNRPIYLEDMIINKCAINNNDDIYYFDYGNFTIRHLYPIN